MRVSVRSKDAWWTTADTPSAQVIGYSRIMGVSWNAETGMFSVSFSDPTDTNGTKIVEKVFNLGEYDAVVIEP